MYNSKSHRYTRTDKVLFGLTFTLFITMFILSDSNLGNALLFLQAFLILGISNFKSGVHRFHLFTFQFCFYIYLTTFWALNGRLTIDVGNTILRTLIVMSVLYSFFATVEDNVRILIKIVMWGGYTVVVYTYFFYGVDTFMEVSDESTRMSNKFNNVNVIGMLAATSIIIHVYFSIFEKFSKSIFLAIPALFVIAATQSRKSIVMLVMGVIFLYFFKTIRGRKDNLLPIMKFVAAIATIVGLVVYLSHTGVFLGLTERMEGLWASITGEGEVDMSADLRSSYRRVGWEQFLSTPLFGVGIGNSPVIMTKAGFNSTYLHCNYVEMLACGGIFGFISYYSIFFYALFQEKKYMKIDKMASLMIAWILVILITDWGAVRYIGKNTYFYVMIFFLHIDNMKKQFPHIGKKVLAK